MVDPWESDVDEALRTLRADVPEIDPRAFAAGRARLLAHLGDPPLTATQPPPSEPVVVALPTATPGPSPPLRRAAPWLGVAAAVAAVAAGAVALLPGDPAPGGGTPVGGSPLSSPAATPSPSTPAGEPGTNRRPGPGRPGEPLPPMPAKELNKAGELADRAANIEVPPGQVLYVRSARSQAGGDGDPGGTDVIEQWIPADREGEWLMRRTSNGNIQGRSDKDFEEQRAPGGRFDNHVIENPWAANSKNMPSLPRDPAALYGMLRERVNADLGSGVGSSMSSAQQAAYDVIMLLADETGAVPADLRAALLRTLGYIPDVTVTTDARTSDNRPAVALAWVVDEGLYRHELLLDPATTRIVEARNVALKPFQGHQPGQAFTSMLVTEAIVAELGQRP